MVVYFVIESCSVLIVRSAGWCVMIRNRVFRTGSGFLRRVTLGAVAVMAAAACLAAFGTAGSAQASTSTPEWHLDYRGHAPALTSVTAVTADNAWAVGTTGTGSSLRPQIMHWNGKSWSVYSIHNIDKFQPVSVQYANGALWIFGYNDGDIDDNPYALIYRGNNVWTSLKLPDQFQPSEAALVGPNDVWGFANTGGNPGCAGSRSTPCSNLEHWNGASWTEVLVDGEVTDLTAVGGHVFILALTGVKHGSGYNIGRPVIYEPTTKIYTKFGPDLQVTDQEDSLVVELDGHVFIQAPLTTGGHPSRFWYFNGKAWAQMSVPANVCPSDFAGYCPLIINGGITADGAQGFWNGYTTHWTGTKWVNADYFAFPGSWTAGFDAVAPIPGTSDIWGVGSFGNGNGGSENTMVADYPALP